MEYCPDRDECFQMFMSLLPRGLAWQDGGGIVAREDSVLQSFWYAIAGPWTDLESAICSQFNELFASTADGDLDLWFAEYGMLEGIDPFGLNLRAKVAATGGTRIEYYQDLAVALGWSTQMRWLKGDDPEFPGVWSTLYVLIDTTTSPALGDILDMENWVIGESALGGADVTDLISILNKLIPAHTEIVTAIEESSPVGGIDFSSSVDSGYIVLFLED